jgi:predicted transcriptional regulator of viral defense system
MRIKKKVYAVIPVEAAGRAYTPNKYLVAAKLQPRSYLSYHTALELHGASRICV